MSLLIAVAEHHAIKARRAGKKLDKDVDFPGIADGVADMAFIEAWREVVGEEWEVDEGLRR